MSESTEQAAAGDAPSPAAGPRGGEAAATPAVRPASPGRAARIEPDAAFLAHLERLGGGTAKRCFQCATCSAVCELARDVRPFPRKEMLWAQWGLAGRLAGDPDVWLCHRCNDCTTHCPRGARPGDVLAAVRAASVMRHSAPRFLARLVNDPRALPLVLAIPFVIVALALQAAGTLAIPEGGPLVYARFVPHLALESLFIGVSALAALAFLVGGVRYWRAMQAGPAGVPGARFLDGLAPALVDIVSHARFRRCAGDGGRSFAHLMVLFGFVALAATAGIAAFAQKVLSFYPPIPLAHPIKWLGNLGAVMVLVGSVMMLARRASGSELAGRSSYVDWLFLLVLFAVAVTGILSEVVRIGGSTSAYGIYFVHLGLVLFLLGFSPYSKFAHIVYRTLAMVHAAAAARAAARQAPEARSAA